MTDLSVRPAICQQEDKKSIKQGFWNFKSVRFQLGLLLCMNYFALAYFRHGLGMAMVCMVNSTAVGLLDGTVHSSRTLVNVTLIEEETCPVTSHVRHDYEGEFVWTPYQQGMLFAAIYWGSLTSFPAGYLADRYSPKHVLSFAMLINVAGSALTPTVAEYGGYPGLFIIRCMMGAGQGLVVPSMNAFISRWIPPNERSTVISLYTFGNQLAGIVGMPFSAWLCRMKSFLGGWPLIFFSASIMGLIFSLIWSIGVTNGPERNPRLPASEKAFILASIQSENTRKGKKIRKQLPWKSIMRSVPVWACIGCNFADGLLIATVYSYLPTYFMEVLHFGLHANGLYSAAPSMVQAVSKFTMAALADKLKTSGSMSATKISKIFNTIGFIGPAIFLVSCSFLTCTQAGLAVTFLCIALGVFGGVTPGYMTSQVALAPSYAGTVSAITTAAFQIGSIVAPYLVGAMTTHGTRQEWQIVFAVISIFLILAGVFYLIFGSAEIQEWAKPPQHVLPDVAVVCQGSLSYSPYFDQESK